MFSYLLKDKRKNEKGAALAIAVIMVAVLSVIALTALAFSSTEARIAGSDLHRMQTFYASAAAIEKMTNDFSNLFLTKISPTPKDLQDIADNPPDALKTEGFNFVQSLEEDTARLNELRSIQGLPNTVYPRVNIADGPFAGLYASVIPYKLFSMATMDSTKAQVKLEREFNNYLVPLFQFGMFSNEDIEVHPGPLMTFNGRVHSNGNIYALRNTKFLNRVTMAGELIRDVNRGGEVNSQSGNTEVYFEVNGINVKSDLGKGSVIAGDGGLGGPNFIGATNGKRGFFPGSPNGIANPSWESESVKPASFGVSNRFGGQVLTNTTGATELKLPLELGGNSPVELIKRALTSDSATLGASRYHDKSQIRILIDDAAAGSGASNAAGIPAGKGVDLASFSPLPLGSGNVLKRVDETTRTYIAGDKLLLQKNTAAGSSTETAMTVRGVKNNTEKISGTYTIPAGAGISGKIYIEIIKPDGTSVDVTRTILSMGMTEGEPNGIVYLQRPLWSAYVQGSRDRSGSGFNLVDLTRNSQTIADGEITNPTALLKPNRGFINTTIAAADDDAGNYTREYTPSSFNSIVPINVYNVREGWVRNSMNEFDIYGRGVTSVVELNMRNLARWVDGIYDTNLLAGTNAVSANIKGDQGYVLYFSDRRGDKVKAEYLTDGSSFASTNGNVDNEDIYGPNNKLDDGEDVIDFGWDSTKGAASKKGTLQKDTTELPDVGTVWSGNGSWTLAQRLTRAQTVLSYRTNYFRRSLRLFDGEQLSFTAAADKLSPTKGITISSENIVYVWGNYNTTGITGIPAGGSTLNDGGFSGPQIPSAIVCDAIFPLSKTWFDALSVLYPEGSSTPRTFSGEAYRIADEGASMTQGTSVRAGIIAGTTVSSLNALPGRDADGQRRNGGIINYPRFLEIWNFNISGVVVTMPWNYSGSLIPLFRSTQALSQWENDTSIIYMPPRRNWGFDGSFLTPNRLPPGTPFFQYTQATGFRPSLK